jgi:anti-sigma regulatory factor (Ser/Thr protein kinase)
VPGAEQRTFTSDVTELRRMSAWWCDWAIAEGLTEDIRDRGELCLNEAAGNVVQHGARPCAIAITLEHHADVVTMVIADDGDTFDPGARELPKLPTSLAEARPGGLGLIILNTAAQASYARVDGWNRLTLTFAS